MSPTLSKPPTWEALLSELDRWSNSGLTATFWFRDDDACEITPQLEQLQELALRYSVEIALAVIPGKLKMELVDRLRSAGTPFHAMCHGWKHIDYGPMGRPGEFGPDRSLSELRADATLAFKEFATYFGVSGMVFVPPYGRVTGALTDSLREIGFAGVSTGPSKVERRFAHILSGLAWLPPVPLNQTRSIPHFDVQIDPFDWARGTSRTIASVGKEMVGHLRLRRRGFVLSGAPIGLLMHHLVHDAATWDLFESLLAALTKHRAVRFARVRGIIESAQTK